jgi:hypothetical protein
LKKNTIITLIVFVLLALLFVLSLLSNPPLLPGESESHGVSPAAAVKLVI